MSEVDVRSIWLRLRNDDAAEINRMVIALAKVLPSDTDDYDLLLSAAVSGDRGATNQLSLALAVDSKVQRWLSMGWLWVSGCYGFKEAQMLLARELAIAAVEPRPPLPADRLSRLSLHWLNGQMSQPQSFLNPHLSKVAAEEEPAPIDGPSLVVLEKVGDPQSKEGVELSNRYRHVVKRPIGFAGVRIDPLLLRREMEGIWPWAAPVARHIASSLDILNRQGDARLRLRPILLVGEPGTGKTSMLEWLCARLQIPRIVVACAGMNDAGGMTSVTRGWATSRPCVPFQIIAETSVANPAIIFDEIDKGAALGGQNGSIAGAAINLLSTSGKFYDSCLMSEVDLSFVNFLSTANDLASMPHPLIERFDVLRVDQPGPEHFDMLLNRMIRDSARSITDPTMGLPEITPQDRKWLLNVFVRSNKSIRSLQKAHSSILSANLNTELDLRGMLH